MTKEALKLALEFVEDVNFGEWQGSTNRQEEIITAIKEALAQPQRPWVDLTDEEITKTYWSREPFKRPTPIGFAREIEQLLKEKKNAML